MIFYICNLGSNKTGVSCPAMIVMKKNVGGNPPAYSVKYVSTHVGHVCELARLRLRTEDRNMIAG